MIDTPRARLVARQGGRCARPAKAVWLGALAVGGATLASPDGQARAEELETVTVSVIQAVIGDLMPVLGQEHGIFAKHGMKLEFVGQTNGPATVAAVASGSVDIGDAPPVLAFPAVQKGGDIVWLMNAYDTDLSLIALNTLPLPSADKGYPAVMADLAGLKIGTAARKSTTEIFASKALAAGGVDPQQDVTFIAVGTGLSAVGALKNGVIDVLPTVATWQFMLEPGSFKTIVDAETNRTSILPGLMANAWATTARFAEEEPELVEGFCRGMMETIAFAKDPANHAVVAAFLAKELALTHEQASWFWNGYQSHFNPRLDEARWRQQAEYTAYLPDWDKHVFEPCAALSQQG